MYETTDSKEYYYSRFRRQFDAWIDKMASKGFVVGPRLNIPIQFLSQENLSHIPQEDYMFFHCTLACTVLIDEVMYTYFRKDYPKFQQMTQCPKIEYGLSNMYARPWDITHSGIGRTILERFVKFFVNDLKEFFTVNKFETATWEEVKKVMLKDEHVIGDSRGEIFKRALKKLAP